MERKHRTEESRKKMTEAKTENNYHRDKRHTEESKQKIREKAIGRKHTEETKRKMSKNHQILMERIILCLKQFIV